jgi:lysine-specific demethylase/histidyl-hydroxylase NO66
MPTPPTRTTPIRATPTTPIRTTPASDGALLRAIAPVAVEEFLDVYWEREPLHVARGEPGRFDDLLSARDVERALEEPGLRLPGFRLVKAGERLDGYTTDLSWRPQPFTDVAETARVVAEVANGATLVLQGLHLTRLPTAVYCRELEARLRHPAQANAYFTPKRSQGLAVHHDTHDVFVLQVSGTKRWQVYEPVWELPLKRQRHTEEMGGPGETVLDVVLGPGDTLYLPRGWLHQALTSDEDSLHLTIGVNVYTWIDAFRAALARCEQDVAFRRSPDGDAAELLERLGDELAPAEDMLGRLVRTRRPILDGQLAQLRSLDRIERVERRPTVIATWDGEALRFEGKAITVPPHARPAVAALVEATGPVGLDDLPGLDDEGRAVLAGRLVREGFLRVLG